MERAASWIRVRLRTHWPLVLIATAATVLVFTALGRAYLWEDEGDTAVLARSILTNGVPVAWDGVTFSAPDFGKRLTDDLVMVSHPWLQYYLAAGAFAIFGESAWAARAPFALTGVATVVLVYGLVWTWTRHRLAAITASLLLVLSVQFLLFSRQARNYTLNAFLTCLLVWQLGRLRTWKGSVGLAFTGIVLFHAHPIGLAAVAALVAVVWLYRPLADRRWLVTWAGAAVALYVTPWLILSRRGYGPNTSWLSDATTFVPRLLQFGVEYASVTPFVGVVVLLAWLAIAARWRARVLPGRRMPILAAGERALLVTAAAILVAEAAAMAVSQSRDAIWIVGLHHTAALIPLTMVAAGVVIARVSGVRRWVWTALFVVFGFTRLAQATPWVFWETPTADRVRSQMVTFHVPHSLVNRTLRTGQLHFIRTLTRPNRGVIARLTEFFRDNAKPTDVVITNYSWEALYFHTRLPQGLKIPASFSIYPVARRKQLPDYVFSPQRVRWIVWRKAWPSAWGQDCERVMAFLRRQGVSITLVRTMPETMWENRENVNFHRFADNTYVFPWFPDVPDLDVYRVDWPDSGHS